MLNHEIKPNPDQPSEISASQCCRSRGRGCRAHHVPVLIYPNPLNPQRYVVLNSGFTFREYDRLNNARQVPKLPDFAIVNVNVPVSPRAPGGIADAGFFGEHWELTKATK